MTLPGEPCFSTVKAVVEKSEFFEYLGPVKGFFRVRSTSEEVFAKMITFQKVFRVHLIKMEKKSEYLVIKLCTSLEHLYCARFFIETTMNALKSHSHFFACLDAVFKLGGF